MAYINPQLQLDQQQQQRADNNYQSIGNAVSGVFQGMKEDRIRALANKERMNQEDLAYSVQGHSSDSIKKMRETGDTSDIMNRNSERAEAARAKATAKEDLERRATEAKIAKDLRVPEAKRDPIAVYQEKLTLRDEQDKLQRQESGEMEVPGFGPVRSKEEAKTIRTALGDVETAKGYIKQITELGKNVAVWDRDRIGKINQLKQALVGKLRLPLMGPGTMTEDEFQRTVGNLGDPGAWFGTEANEIGKLEQMSGILDNNIKTMYSAAAKGAPSPQRQVAPVDPIILKKIQSYTPEQAEARKQELMQRKAASQGGR
jgi:hypothetical protein